MVCVHTLVLYSNDKTTLSNLDGVTIVFAVFAMVIACLATMSDCAQLLFYQPRQPSLLLFSSVMRLQTFDMPRPVEWKLRL